MTQELIVQDNNLIIRAELDMQINTAKAYPRNPPKAIDYACQLATFDEETARSCFYTLPRKNKEGERVEITGPSIRLAEIIASCWGNIHVASRIVENDGKHITAEGAAWDLENNYKQTAPIKVSIMFGKGSNQYQANQDMQTVLAASASAKARRNAIFSVIPRSYVNKALEHCKKFVIGDQRTINSRVIEIFDKLVKMGLDRQEILNYYGKKNLSEITPEDFTSLIGIGTAIKEGHIKIEEVFKEENKPEKGQAAAIINQFIADKRKLSGENAEG